MERRRSREYDIRREQGRPDWLAAAAARLRWRLFGVFFVFTVTFGPLLVVGAIVVVGRMIGVLERPQQPTLEQAAAEFKTGNPFVALTLLNKVKATPDPNRREVAEGLKACLKEGSDKDRMDALMHLRGWGGPQDAVAVVPLTKDPSLTVRGTAIGTLGELKGPTALESLLDLLESRDTRGDAAKALGKIGTAAEEALLERAEHPDEQMRVCVVGLLGSCGTARSLPVLENALADPDQWVRLAAISAKREILQRK